MSFDGLGAQQFTAQSMPRIWRLSQQGWRGEGVPPLPSTTFNGHAAMATGCWPEHHGIVGNSFVDPEKGFVGYTATAELLQREPLWVAAADSGLKAAVYHWPCATGPWHGVSPWRLQVFAKDQAHPDQDALAFSEAALRDGADLVMAYLSGTDEEGHHHGPGSPQMQAKLARLDALVAPWIERMEAQHPGLRIILTGDHGMLAMHQRISLPAILNGSAARIVAHGGSAYVHPKPGRLEEAETRLKAAGLQVWRREELPDSFHLKGNPRVGELVVEAPEGSWLAQDSWIRGYFERKGRIGAHGCVADHPALHSWLIVLGHGQGELGPVPLWDLAPTISAWLRIHWQQAPDGHEVEALR